MWWRWAWQTISVADTHKCAINLNSDEAARRLARTFNGTRSAPLSCCFVLLLQTDSRPAIRTFDFPTKYPFFTAPFSYTGFIACRAFTSIHFVDCSYGQCLHAVSSLSSAPHSRSLAIVACLAASRCSIERLPRSMPPRDIPSTPTASWPLWERRRYPLLT